MKSDPLQHTTKDTFYQDYQNRIIDGYLLNKGQKLIHMNIPMMVGDSPKKFRDIERNESLLLKNITYDNILINIYQVLQNSKLFKNCKT